jgi:type VI secretion system ImpM family protein
MTAMLFGKLPAHGDFVSRGIAPDVRDRWDVELSTSLAAARGESFDAHYGAAPPWRFVRPEGEGWLAGAIALSMDSAGRRFPIVGGVFIDTLSLAESTGAGCEAALFSALGEGWNADTLNVALAGIAVTDTSDIDAGSGLWWVDGGGDIGIAPLSGPLPPTLISAMLGVMEIAG